MIKLCSVFKYKNATLIDCEKLKGNDLLMKSNSQIHLLKEKDDTFNALARQGLFKIELTLGTTPTEQNNVTNTLKQLRSEKLMPDFLQAVMDDDQKKVREILDDNPELLLTKPSQNLVIESKFTWQKFYAEPALDIAVKRKQIKMVKLLLSYYDKLEQTEDIIRERANALSKWSFCKVRRNIYDDKNEIVVNREHYKYALSLIDVFAHEKFPNGIDPDGFEVKLSEKTELALSDLYNTKLFPKSPVKLDDYIDVELFLWTLYIAYRDNPRAFQNDCQKDAFCIFVIGLAQSALTPEIAKIICQSLLDEANVIEFGHERTVLESDMSLYIKNLDLFYRECRDSKKGLGYEWYMGPCGWSRKFGTVPVFDFSSLEVVYLDKSANFRKLTQELNQQLEKKSDCCDLFQSSCAIL